MLKSIKTSAANKQVVSELTSRLSLGPENIIARIAFAYSLSKEEKLSLHNIRDAKGKEYRSTILFGDHTAHYVAMVCALYGLHKTDKDIPKYVKLHLDHGLELLQEEYNEAGNTTGFDFLIRKVENAF